ncbi:hypothetical protein OUZ56_016364 [Daphnia magna]|uniref:Uncharacterized protein n=1 Tax=Daphnia magna TaxID=35525 RepID=A0ABR0AQF5_9CRUS|nr:hypothetical protein OUZ56_016364 [Daphnia magna]
MDISSGCKAHKDKGKREVIDVINGFGHVLSKPSRKRMRYMTPWESPGGDKFLPLVESEVGEEIILETGKRRWAFTSRDILIQPYYKKTMMLSEPMLALTDSSRSIPAPRSLKTAFDLDFIWMCAE